MIGHNLVVKNARALALTGVVLTAMLMVAIARPALREIIGWHGRPWLGVLMLGVPTVALLTATGYRYYGARRALAVALIVVVISGLATAICAVVAVGAAQMPSGSTLLVLGLIFGTPIVSVLVLGVLACRLAGPGKTAVR